MQAQYDTCYSSRLMSIGYCHTIPDPYSTVADPRCATSGVDDFSGSSFSRGSSSSLAYLHEDYRYMNDLEAPSSCPDDTGDDGGGIGNSFSSPSSTPTMMYTHAPSSQTMNIGFGGSGTGIGIGYTEDGSAVLERFDGQHREEGPAFYDQAVVPRWEWDCPPMAPIPTPLQPCHLAYPYQHPTTLLPPHPPHNDTGADVSLNLMMSTIKSAVRPAEQQPPPTFYHPLIHSSPTTAPPHFSPVSPATMPTISSSSLSTGGRQNEQISHAHARLLVDTAHLPPTLRPAIAAVAAATASSSPVRRVASNARTPISNTTDMLSREKKHACTMCHKRSAGEFKNILANALA